MEAKHITKQNFQEEVLNAEGPVLVDFWATWCGPCQKLSPVIEEIAKEAPAGIKVGKINIDEEMELAQEFKVMSIPTLIVFKGGKAVSQSFGVQSKKAILEMVEKAK